MKTHTIEIDEDTATTLKRRAAERGVSVPELVAELVTLDTRPTEANSEDIAELDRRWRPFQAQSAIAPNEEVVRWLQSWGTPAYRKWRDRKSRD